MKLLINASILSPNGGSAQVADSICRELSKFNEHSFVVVLPDGFSTTTKSIKSFPNVDVVTYNYPLKDWKSLLTKRNAFLDNLVETRGIKCVLTIFGPSKWVPKCKHVSGFAIPHLPFPDSPFFIGMSLVNRLKAALFREGIKYLLGRSANVLFTENPLVSDILKDIYPKKTVYTVTNNYNQIFDNKGQWQQFEIPEFNGTQFLSVSSMMPHKNLRFTIEVARALRLAHPDFRFRFVLTVDREKFGVLPEGFSDCFFFTGPVHISKVPSLYQQTDIVFQPSLLECFSASYPEAMRMEKPLVVPKLPFAEGLCDDAALYFSPLSADEAAGQLYKLSKEKELRKVLVKNGLKQLNKYDSYQQRAEKLIRICEAL